MSAQETKEVLKDINDQLRASDPYMCEIEGRPSFRVISQRPYNTEAYGRILRRGPHLVGTFPLDHLITLPSWRPDTVNIATVFQVGDSALYGFRLPSTAEHFDFLNQLGEDLGVPITAGRN
jgi:hypothetical protein